MAETTYDKAGVGADSGADPAVGTDTYSNTRCLGLTREPEMRNVGDCRGLRCDSCRTNRFSDWLARTSDDRVQGIHSPDRQVEYRI